MAPPPKPPVICIDLHSNPRNQRKLYINDGSTFTYFHQPSPSSSSSASASSSISSQTSTHITSSTPVKRPVPRHLLRTSNAPQMVGRARVAPPSNIQRVVRERLRNLPPRNLPTNHIEKLRTNIAHETLINQRYNTQNVSPPDATYTCRNRTRNTVHPRDLSTILDERLSYDLGQNMSSTPKSRTRNIAPQSILSTRKDKTRLIDPITPSKNIQFSTPNAPSNEFFTMSSSQFKDARSRISDSTLEVTDVNFFNQIEDKTMIEAGQLMDKIRSFENKFASLSNHLHDDRR